MNHLLGDYKFINFIFLETEFIKILFLVTQVTIRLKKATYLMGGAFL